MQVVRVPALPMASRGVEHKRGDNVCGQSWQVMIDGNGWLWFSTATSGTISVARGQHCWVGGLDGWVGGWFSLFSQQGYINTGGPKKGPGAKSCMRPSGLQEGSVAANR